MVYGGMMKVNGKYYTFKKNDGIGYGIDLQKCIEETCQYCIEQSNMNADEKINKPIMMLGKIQSGKTRAFTGVISLAFDNDFDIVFILTKNSKALVQQTVSRMKKEFSFEKNSVIVSDIIKASRKISLYELSQKNIIVAKKEKTNIAKLIDFIQKYSINQNKKCIIIDDEADTTGIGYEKKKGSDEYTLRTVASKVNEMRGTLDGCVFIEVTATPYALYLQPDFDETAPIKPIKPLKTILVPHGEDYIGGDYYFIKSNDDKHPASLLFKPMDQNECDLVSDQKRKGKKSKIEDRRSFKEEEILIRNDRLPILKKGIINFIVGAITLRETYANTHYAYVIHTATQKNSHFNLESIAETFIAQIREKTSESLDLIDSLIKESYDDIKMSVEQYGCNMPSFEYIKEKFFYYIENEFYSIDVVNGDNDVDALLDEETGELSLRTPCSIFVGGQILDRGVTIPNMIGFYYGRNPNTMQQDTVLQHSRMFGYRKHLLPVTRFYTSERIHNNMVKMTETDELLRSEIAKGAQGEGIYFIANQRQESKYGKGAIKPCSPSKIMKSDIMVLKSHQRILPIGFSPVTKTEYKVKESLINKIIHDAEKIDDNSFKVQYEKAIDLIGLIYRTVSKDDDSHRFINETEFITLLDYFLKEKKDYVVFHIYRNMNLSKYKKDGVKLQDAPDTSSSHFAKAKENAIDRPVIMAFQENGNDSSWNYRPFWWPVLVAPKKIPNVIYASKIAK